MTEGVTVALPVGPFEANQRWLYDAIESVQKQTHHPFIELLLIDDGADLPLPDLFSDAVRVWKCPWRVGVAHAFNFGVGLASYDLVFFMGSDDTLEPECIEKCVEAWEKNERKDGYYHVPIRYMDTGDEQGVPCNYAMITKGLWELTGGFPPETAVGAPDAAFISMLMKHRPDLLCKVGGGKPLVNYRRHEESDTVKRAPWQAAILEVRKVLTESPPWM